MFIVQLHADQSIEWYEVNATGELLVRQTFASLADCPKINSQETLIVLLPGEQVMLTTVKLPRMRASERLRAVPFALEEQLAGDPEAIHAALGEHARDGSYIVAVLDKHYLAKQYEQLRSENLNPRVVLPDFLALHLEPDAWTVFYHNKMVLVRTGQQSGFTVDAHNAVVFLQLLLEKAGDALPKRIICWANDHVVNFEALGKYGVKIELQGDAHTNFLDTKTLASKTVFNLLQGKYRPSGQRGSAYRSWFLCGALAAGFVGLSLLSDVTAWLRLHYQSEQLQTQVLQAYQNIFPGAAQVLEPRFRVEALLKQYEEAARGSVFAQLLWTGGKSLASFPRVQAELIRFDDDTLSFTVNADNMTLLSDWLAALHKESIHLEQHIVSQADGVSAVIKLSNKASA